MIDLNALQDHYGSDISLVKEILIIFEDNYLKTIEDLKGAVCENNIKKVELHAHTLKGMLLNFFVQDLVEIAFSIEENAREGSVAGVEDKIEFIEKNIPTFINEIKGMK